MKTPQGGCNWKHILFIALTQLRYLLIYSNNMLYAKISLRYKEKSQGNSRKVSSPLTEILWYVIKFLPAVCSSPILICMFSCLGIHGQVALGVSLHIHFLIQFFEAS